MPLANYQTIRLSKGKHSSPEEGACVIELASMLAGEPFTDNPASVCPVIASFLRAYNDSVDDERRQDLYAYAAKIVGSRACVEVQSARAERLAAWRFEALRRRWWGFLLPPSAVAISSMLTSPGDSVGTSAVRSIRTHTDETHVAALTLVEELLAIGRRTEARGHRAKSPHASGDTDGLIVSVPSTRR
jgi:hypothetical protein